jgi:anaerobic dimethyl sulfoxide reductase subunit B
VRYSFTFDAAACTGCKSCQVACKDKNGLPLGVLWRRVYEVSGGTWERRGAAWTNSVFAYNVSVGCNHCADPACASACPSDAYVIREDGIVWLDSTRCIGCEYCAWACPYSAPQYSPDLGYTTKCDGCKDLVDEGLPPACVAACPMRALEFTTVDDWKAPVTKHPFPLPAAARTKPLLAVRPHPAMLDERPRAVANREEIRPGVQATDLSLAAFTLLGQTAAGVAIVSLLRRTPLDRPLHLTIGLLAALAAAVSLLHLGKASRAWRAPRHARISPLSREVVMLTTFGAMWVVALFAPAAGHVALAVSGAALIYSMAEVYRLDAVPGWNTWRTHAAFAFSGMILGMVGVLVVSDRIAHAGWFLVLAVAVAAQQVAGRRRFYGRRRLKVM